MMRNNLRAVIGKVTSGGGRSVVSRRYFSSPAVSEEAEGGVDVRLYLRFLASVAGGYAIGYFNGKDAMDNLAEEMKQELKQEYEGKLSVGNSPGMDVSSSPRLSLDSSSLNELPREEVNNIVLALVEMENKHEELENEHNSTNEELNQMKKIMKAKFSRVFK